MSEKIPVYNIFRQVKYSRLKINDNFGSDENLLISKTTAIFPLKALYLQ